MNLQKRFKFDTGLKVDKNEKFIKPKKKFRSLTLKGEMNERIDDHY